MFIRILIFVIITLSPCCRAQTISKGKAMEFADQLSRKKILTQEGKNILIDIINTDAFSTLDNNAADSSITHAALLRYCHMAFLQELLYRYGYVQSKAITKKRLRQQRRARKRFGEDYQGFEAWYQEQGELDSKRIEGLFLKRRSIEDAIPAEDSAVQFWTVLPPLGFTYGLKNVVETSRSVMGKTRTRTAKDILDIGLIDKKIFDDVMKGIKDSTIATEGEVFNVAAIQSEFYQTYPTEKTDQLVFLDSLVACNVLLPVNRDLLVNNYQPFELKDDFEILKYCNNSILLDTKGYSDPFTFVPEAYGQLRKIIPGFDFDDLTIQLDSAHMDRGYMRYDVVVSFKINEVEYKQRIGYDLMSDGDSLNNSNAYLLSYADFHSGVNAWLADQVSPFRLYKAVRQLENWENFTIGLILLTEEQRMISPGLDFLGDENHHASLDKKYVKKLIAALDSIGLFSHLTKDQIDSARQEVLWQSVHSATDVLHYFPNLIHNFYWDTTIEGPYKANCLAFADIARGGFTPQNVYDNFSKKGSTRRGKVTCYFEYNGKKYSKSLRGTADWLAPEFVALIKEAMDDNPGNGNFYSIDGPDSGAFIFLTSQQYEYMKGHIPQIQLN